MPTPMHNRIERFWKKVKKAGPNKCWEWQGALGGLEGYGKVLWSSKPKKWWRRAHKVVWELEHGLIEDKSLCVCHTCDNPLCCNPAHLWLGTRRDNNKDKQLKGRDYDRNGSLNPRAKLSEQKVEAIRGLLALGYSQTRVAEFFDMSQPQISKIQHGTAWKNNGCV